MFSPRSLGVLTLLAACLSPSRAGHTAWGISFVLTNFPSDFYEGVALSKLTAQGDKANVKATIWFATERFSLIDSLPPCRLQSQLQGIGPPLQSGIATSVMCCPYPEGSEPTKVEVVACADSYETPSIAYAVVRYICFKHNF